MRTNTTNRTRQKNNSNFPSQNTPTPPRQLSIRYMPILLVWWAFLCFVVLLFVLVPRCLKNPAIQAHSVETRVLCNTHGWLSQSFGVDCFIVFSYHTIYFRTTDALLNDLMAVSTLTPRIMKSSSDIKTYSHTKYDSR